MRLDEYSECEGCWLRVLMGERLEAAATKPRRALLMAVKGLELDAGKEEASARGVPILPRRSGRIIWLDDAWALLRSIKLADGLAVLVAPTPAA